MSLEMEEVPTVPQAPPQSAINLSTQELLMIYNLNDIDAWSYSDDILIAAALSVWQADAYGHFNKGVYRHYRRGPTGEMEPDHIQYVFRCKYDPDHCKVQRKRKNTGRDGTQNLRKAIRRCDARRQVPDSLASLPVALIPYSHIMFRALLVIWCVVSHRPFHTVADPIFLDIVHMLRPEAVVPTPHTLSTDLSYIYGLATTRVRDMFLQMETGAHLAIDGWSSPLKASFLGIVVFWRTGSTLWRSVLDFVHLTQSHTGVYLAEKTLECLDRFGLRHHIVSMCLDNASNNDVLVRHLARSLPNFPGPQFRGRCMAHIINLIAKAFMSVFSRPSPKKRKIAANARVLAKRSAPNNSTPQSSAIGDSPTNEPTEQADPELPPLDELDTALDVTGELPDEGMEQHDTIEVQKAVSTAIEGMAELYGLRLSDNELKEAREIFPKAAGFANQIHGSGTLYAAFVELRNTCKDLLTTKKEVPTQRVVTRWGADAACGKTHEELRIVIDMMTSRPGYKLMKYHMPTGEWDLLMDVNECLDVFDQPTKVHSQTNTPLIHEVVPHMHLLKFRLELMRDGAVINPRTGQPPRLVIRVAAFAALNILNKYLKLLEASDIYWLAIALCPWYKLQWFENNNYSESHIQRVRRLLNSRFEHYVARSGPALSPELTNAASSPANVPHPPGGFWMQYPTSTHRSSTASRSNPLSVYLTAPPIDEAEIDKIGGLLQFWEYEVKAGSVLGEMALDILSAPSSSVDAERAFSGGRMSVNYRQHRTSVPTFRAKMAVGSWFGTPLLSDATEVLDMLDGIGNSEPEALDLD